MSPRSTSSSAASTRSFEKPEPPPMRIAPVLRVFISASLELGRTLGVKRLDSFLEVVGLTQPAVAMALQLDCDRERGILGVVKQLLRRALRERRERAQFIHQRISRLLELGIWHAFGRDAPLASLPPRNALGAHHDVLGARDTDDLLQPRRTAGAGYLPESLFGQRIETRFRHDAEIAGKRQLEADAETEAAVRDDHRLRAAHRRRDIPGELRDG